MNCGVAGHLMDGYLENTLSAYERQRFEAHLASCPGCRAEMHGRSSLDRAIGEALTAAVHDRVPAASATAATIRSAQGALRRSLWSRRVGLTFQVMAAAAALALVMVGVLWWQAGIPIPSTIGPIPVARIKQFIITEVSPTSKTPVEGLGLLDPDSRVYPANPEVGLSLTRGESLVEPAKLHPGEPFTVTALLESTLPQPLDSAHIELGIDGPTGYYDFALVVRGPFQAQSVSVLEVTSEDLAVPCREKYLQAPTDIFRQPGRYVVRVALSTLPASAGH